MKCGKLKKNKEKKTFEPKISNFSVLFNEKRILTVQFMSELVGREQICVKVVFSGSSNHSHAERSCGNDVHDHNTCSMVLIHRHCWFSLLVEISLGQIDYMYRKWKNGLEFHYSTMVRTVLYAVWQKLFGIQEAVLHSVWQGCFLTVTRAKWTATAC